MKQSVTPRKWKRILSAGLSFALAAAMLPPPTSILASAAETAETEGSLEKMPVKDKTPVPDKAGSISMSQLEDNITQKHPFPKGTAGSDVFRIPAMITMENGELLAIADARYTQPTDGNGLRLPPFPVTAEQLGNTAFHSSSQTATEIRTDNRRHLSTPGC